MPAGLAARGVKEECVRHLRRHGSWSACASGRCVYRVPKSGSSLPARKRLLNALRRRQSGPRRCPSSVRGSGRRPFRRGLLSSLTPHGSFREWERLDDDARVRSYFLPGLLDPTDGVTLRLLQCRSLPLRDHFPRTGRTGRQRTGRRRLPGSKRDRPSAGGARRTCRKRRTCAGRGLRHGRARELLDERPRRVVGDVKNMRLHERD